MKNKSIRKKSVAVLAGVAIAGAVGASAASLGGIDGNSLGADSSDVISCDSDGVTVDYETRFEARSGEYVVEALIVSGVDKACDGLVFDITVFEDATTFTNLAHEKGVVSLGGGGPSGDHQFKVGLASPISAELVDGVAVVISG